MKLEIIIEKNMIACRVTEGKKIIGETNWPIDNNMSGEMLPRIEKLLKDNRLEISDIKKAVLKSDLKENFTTYRIAKSVADSINFTK